MSNEDQINNETKEVKKAEKIINYIMEINNKHYLNSSKNIFLNEIKDNPDRISALPKERLELLDREYEKEIQILEMKLEKRKNKQILILKRKKM